MNIIVFGKNGQLGKAFEKQLEKSYFQKGNLIRHVGREECDLCDRSQIENLLYDFSPHLIINAAAYTAVDNAENEPELVFAVNAIAPKVMAEYAIKKGATLLHFSSDYVFDGLKQGEYNEVDKTNPLSIYGKSKEAGESAIVKEFEVASNELSRYAILRTSWVYGDGNNFIRTILRLAKDLSEIKVVNDQHGIPTSADWLAEVGCYLTINQDSPRWFTSGIYHATPHGKTTWYGLACLTVELALLTGRALRLSPSAIFPISTIEYPLPAPRPMNSCLSSKKLADEVERLGIMSKLTNWITPWNEQVLNYIKLQN